MTKQLRDAYRFFREHAGYIVGRRALGAYALAKAEQYAALVGYEIVWEYDYDAELGEHELWCSDAARGRCKGHECLSAVLRDVCGEVRASLGSIIEPDANHRRLIEAELALEAMPGGVR
jgi:hypothetical protein